MELVIRQRTAPGTPALMQVSFRYEASPVCEMHMSLLCEVGEPYIPEAIRMLRDRGLNTFVVEIPDKPYMITALRRPSDRCNLCDACKKIAEVQRDILREFRAVPATPYGIPLGETARVLWNNALFDYPCACWEEPYEHLWLRSNDLHSG